MPCPNACKMLGLASLIAASVALVAEAADTMRRPIIRLYTYPSTFQQNEFPVLYKNAPPLGLRGKSIGSPLLVAALLFAAVAVVSCILKCFKFQNSNVNSRSFSANKRRLASGGSDPCEVPSASPEEAPFAVLWPSAESQRTRIQELLHDIEIGSIPSAQTDFDNLFKSLLKAAGNYRGTGYLPIEGLTRYLAQERKFAKTTLPFLASVARHLPDLFPQGLKHMMRSHPSVHLRRIQVLGLMAASFFGTIPHNQRELLKKFGDLRLNALNMHSKGFFNREPKLKALLTYFSEMQKTMGSCWEMMLKNNDFTQAKCPAACSCQEGRVGSTSPVDEIISFYLHTPEATTFVAPGGQKVQRSSVDVDAIVSQPLPLSDATVDLHGDITKSDGNLQVDFADRFLGGLSMFEGHIAQEELLFALRPELHAIMLFKPALKDDEAVVIKGAESFVDYTGYEKTFKVFPPEVPVGSHWSVHRRTPLDSMGRRETTLVGIDAIQFRDKKKQYSIQSMKREILKAALGFQGDPFESSIHEGRAGVATGKWGCVIFNGDNELKTLLQWIALSAVGRTMHYKAFGDSQLESMEETLLAIRSRFPTTKDLFGAIVECIQQREESPGDEWSLWQSLLKLETKKPQ